MTVPLGVFLPLDYGRMLIANDQIGALADRVALEMPRIVEDIRMIDQPVRAQDVAA